MKTTHTAGEWSTSAYYDGKQSKGQIILSDATGKTLIGEIYSNKEQDANARLIASAPHLLETIQTMHSILSGWSKDGKYLNEIEYLQAAINKATGN